jgi:hypothetical protein
MDCNFQNMSQNKPFSHYELFITGICYSKGYLANTLTFMDAICHVCHSCKEQKVGNTARARAGRQLPQLGFLMEL